MGCVIGSLGMGLHVMEAAIGCEEVRVGCSGYRDWARKTFIRGNL